MAAAKNSTQKGLAIARNNAPKHTPGPWAVEQATATMTGAKLPGQFWIKGPGRPHIGSVGVGVPKRLMEDTANARLIAAAPELFEALKRWQRFARDNGWTDEDYHDADGTGWISATTAAVRRAEGAEA
jgi:hypothetical protein